MICPELPARSIALGTADALTTVEIADGVSHVSVPGDPERTVGLYAADVNLSVPTWLTWLVSERAGEIALGVAMGDAADVFGTGLNNLFYLSSGRIVLNGAVVATAPPINSGDTVGLFFDLAGGVGDFYLNRTRVF